MATKLSIQINNAWLHILSIPTEEIHKFTLRPLKWLCFLGFIIYGHEGILLSGPQDLEVDSYDIGISQLQDHYYFFSEGPPRLLDVQGLNDRTTNSLSHSRLSQIIFADDVTNRDETCIISREPPELCSPSHCLPHSKGDHYIEQLRRFRSNSDNDIIGEINSSRNGFLLFCSLHYYVGHGQSAFIQTPNFKLSRDDIPPSPRPVDAIHTERLTLQHFQDPSCGTTLISPHNQDARLPADLQDWPPILITNFVYGCTVVKCWGNMDSITTLQKLTQDTYYNPEAQTQMDDQAKDACHMEQHKVWADRLSKRNADQGAGQGVGEAEQQEMSMEDIMDFVACLWHQSSRSEMPMQQGPSEEDVSREKVEAWLQSQ